MTFSSRYHALATGLSALLEADADLAAVKVFDGPTVDRGSYQQWLTVGWTDDPRDVEAGDSRQDWLTDGGTSASRSETIRLRCSLLTWDGGTDVAATRARAFTYMAAVEAAIRNAYTLGIDGLMWAHLADFRVYQGLSEGAAVEVRFTIEARAVI